MQAFYGPILFDRKGVLVYNPNVNASVAQLVEQLIRNQ